MNGRHVLVAFRGFLAAGRRPDTITGHDRQRWTVERVDGFWEHPQAAAYGKVPGRYRAETRRWTLTVRGPLPGRPGEVGLQQVTIRSYGDGAGWWMFPEE